MEGLLAELKRRNVFKVAVAYCVVGWLVIQITGEAVPALAMPDWVPTVVFFFFIIGFPFILLFAWAFEVTPDGIKRSKHVAIEQSITSTTGQRLNYMIMGVLGIALVYFIYESRIANPGSGLPALASADEEASIAVLPFVNMSSDPEQEYFTDGISEELLNVLAQIPELKVAARTSSFAFKGKNQDLREIGDSLGVAHLLEGSVRRSGDTLRITAQLIRADDGFHLWSETYDREMEDVFAIQDEISTAIVDALSATLGIQTADAKPVATASNSEAYSAYLQGKFLLRQRTKQSIEAAQVNLERALELDPEFEPAHTALALTWVLLRRNNATYGTLDTDVALAKAEPHISKALDLKPDSAEALAVRGLMFEAKFEHEKALEFLERALAINPSLSAARSWYAAVLTDLGRPQESFEQTARAFEADPLSPLLLNNYSNELLIRHRWEDLGTVIDKVKKVDPARAMRLTGQAEFLKGNVARSIGYSFRAQQINDEGSRDKATIAHRMLDLGLVEEFRRLHPYEDTEIVILRHQRIGDELINRLRKRLASDPDNIGWQIGLAFNLMAYGSHEEAYAIAEKVYDQLDPQARPRNGVNWLFADRESRAGDYDAVREHLAFFIDDVNRSEASGIKLNYIHENRAQIAAMLGDEKAALEHLELTLGKEMPGIYMPTYFEQVLDWADKPGYQAIRSQQLAHTKREQQLLLSMGCQREGIPGWKPLEESCALLEQSR